MLLKSCPLPPSLLSISDAIPSADQVRITPSLRSQRGTVWTKNKVNFEHWEAEVTFRVSGRGRMGADGLVSRAGNVGVGYGGSQQMCSSKELTSKLVIAVVQLSYGLWWDNIQPWSALSCSLHSLHQMIAILMMKNKPNHKPNLTISWIEK